MAARRARASTAASPTAGGGPDLSVEATFGARRVAGVDEAGRGPLAGPVVAAAVVLDRDHVPAGLDDSKRLSVAARERLFDEILAGHAVAVALSSVGRIDATDIRAATLDAMRRAVNGLAEPPEHVLVDGIDVPPGLPCGGSALVGGDGRSASIAAASIVAKVLRDRLMTAAGAEHPGWGFEVHKGYGTEMHRDALARLGASPLHRKSFGPVADALGLPRKAKTPAAVERGGRAAKKAKTPPEGQDDLFG